MRSGSSYFIVETKVGRELDSKAMVLVPVIRGEGCPTFPTSTLPQFGLLLCMQRCLLTQTFSKEFSRMTTISD